MFNYSYQQMRVLAHFPINGGFSSFLHKNDQARDGLQRALFDAYCTTSEYNVMAGSELPHKHSNGKKNGKCHTYKFENHKITIVSKKNAPGILFTKRSNFWP